MSMAERLMEIPMPQAVIPMEILVIPMENLWHLMVISMEIPLCWQNDEKRWKRR
jgi:hypothetical protein